MRIRVWIFSLTLLLTLQLCGQNLRLADIQTMLKCATWSEVNVKLINKGWTYSASEVGSDTRESVITWSYRENAYTEKAQGWFYLVTYHNVPAKVRYQVGQIDVYNSILNGVVNSGYKLSSSQVLDNQLWSKYENTSWIVTFIKTKGEEDYYSKTYNIIEVVEKGTHYDPDNGPFEVLLSDSLTMKANLKGGKMDGDCKFYNQSGWVVREGKFKNGLKEGKWNRYDYDMYGQKIATYYTNYKADVETGEYCHKTTNGTERGTYVNGKIQGPVEGFNRDGKTTLKTVLNQDSLDGTTYYYIWSSSGVCLDTLFATYKMGALDGPCEFWYGDQYIEGSFKNDQRDGYCKVYSNESVLLGDEMIPGSLFFIQAEGTYQNGKRVGMWKEYTMGKLRHEGQYANDKKNGEWKSYAVLWKDGEQVQESITYKNDFKNGPCKSYFDLDLVPCADSTKGCMEWKRTPNTLDGSFLNDQPDGSWTKKDSSGRILYTGSYISGLKTGQWKYNTYKEGEVYVTVVNYMSGLEHGATTTTSSTRGLLWQANYTNGKFSGPVTTYFPSSPDVVECKMNYVADQFVGEYTWTDRSGHEISGLYYNNRIASCIVNDSLGKLVYSLENIVLISGTKYASLYTVETDSGEVAQQITFDIGISYDSIMPYTFLWNFEAERDNFRLTHTGTYSLTHNSALIVWGQKVNGVKSGTWDYKYNPEVTWKVTYKDGAVVDEYFITSAGAFSGKYRATFPGNNESVMFKVEESRRDGKSEYERNGKVYKTEKYKKGVLQD